MFGLEKKKRKPFEFDLEKEIKKDKKKKKEVLLEVEKKSQALKESLRDGTAQDNFDQCGILLQGYAALNKVVDRISR